MQFLPQKRGVAAPARRRRPATAEEQGNAFRRGKSLGGSLVDEVRAPAEATSSLKSDRVIAQNKRQKHRSVRRKLLYVALACLFVVFLYSHYIRGFRVDYAQQTTAQPTTTQYQETARQFAAKSMTNRFAFSIDKQQLAAYLQDRHKEILAVSVETAPFSGQPKLAITLRQPVLMWQTTRDPEASFVDANGVSFTLPSFTQTDKLVLVNDDSGVGMDLGVPVASSRQISFLGQYVGQFSALAGDKFAIAKLVFPPSSTKEVQVLLKDRKYFVKLYLDRSPKAQAEATISALSYFAQHDKSPDEYLDVRVAEKVFYK